MKKLNLRSVILNLIVCCTMTGLSTAQESTRVLPTNIDGAVYCMPLPECWFPLGNQ